MQFELTREYIEALRKVIDNKDEQGVLELIHELHPADIAEIYEEINKEQALFLFELFDDETAADVFSELEEDEQEDLLKLLPKEVVAKKIIHNMDSDDAADFIGEMSNKDQEEILAHIDDIDQAGDIVDLLNYEKDTAGGLMAKELVVVNENWTVLRCFQEISRQAEDIDEIYNVYVTNNENILLGYLSLKEMIVSPTSAKISSIYEDDVISVKTDEDSEEVAKIMEKYDLVALPVIDGIGRLMGRITIDDVVDIIKEQAEKDYQMMSGISEDVESTDNVWLQTRARIPWLIVAVFGGILASRVIANFEGALNNLSEAAMFIPLITGMGGNVGIQSSAIIVQGLANNSLGIESTGRKLFRELGIATINGLCLSSIILLYNYLAGENYILTISVSVALFSVIIFATIFGTLVPLVLDKLKIDPALATGPFITTMDDIMGVLIYFIIVSSF